MSIVVLGAVFVDIKGFPESQYIPDGRNVGRIEYIQGGVSRNVVGKEAVDEGIIDSIGGIADAFQKLYSMIDETRM